MTPEWRQFLWKVTGWVGAALIVHAATSILLGGPLDYVVPSILVAGAAHLAFFERTPLPNGNFLKRGIGLLLVSFAAWLTVPDNAREGMFWQPYSEEILDAARRGGKPVVIEFTVAGCGPCIAMQKRVFPRRRVVEAARPFLAMKADLTKADAAAMELSERYQIEAFPTFVFIDSTGKERVNLRLVGFELAESFAQRLEAAR